MRWQDTCFPFGRDCGYYCCTAAVRVSDAAIQNECSHSNRQVRYYSKYVVYVRTYGTFSHVKCSVHHTTPPFLT